MYPYVGEVEFMYFPRGVGVGGWVMGLVSVGDGSRLKKS